MADDFWPPRPFDLAFTRFRELDAWYAGNAQVLSEIYSGIATPATGPAALSTHTINGQPYRGGVLGTLSKWFLGQPMKQGEQRMRMHLPLAADLCTLSSDLLFGEGLQVLFRKPEDETSSDTTGQVQKRWQHPSQARLETIAQSDEARAEFLLAGEYSAALGGSYIAAAWDPDVADSVFPRAYAADCAIPVFRHGRLMSVTLWTEFHDGIDVYRLLEEHNRGTITYTLHQGTAITLGKSVPLDTRPETVHYAKMRNVSDLTGDGPLPNSMTLGTGSDRLAVTYLKNAQPVPDWRKEGQLAFLGRSDLDGIQDELDKVDMAWSSLMRDIENGQGRLVIPEEMLDLSGKPGEGASFDTYRQVFAPVGGTLGKSADGGSPMTIVQFAIRVEEHLAVIKALKKEIASRVGYSESHLGIDESTRGMRTATDVQADLSDSERTRDKKALYAKAALSKWAVAALEIDHTVFPQQSGTLGDMSVLPDIVFPDVSQADPEKMARTAQLLDMARAASRETIVRTVHPDWDDDDVRDEAEKILQEFSSPDPATFAGDPHMNQPAPGAGNQTDPTAV